MKKKLYSLATAILCCLSSWAQVPQLQSSSDPVDGGKYYFYNVKTGKWLNHGYGRDNLQFGVDETGYLYELEAMNDGFAIRTGRDTWNWHEEPAGSGQWIPWLTQLYYGWDDSKQSYFALRGDKEQFDFIPVDGQEGCYRIKLAYGGFGENRYIAAVGNDNDPVTATFEEGADIWKLITHKDFKSRLKGVEAENGGKYYLYNITTGKWFTTSGHTYGSVTENANVVSLETYNDNGNLIEGSFAINTPDVADYTTFGWNWNNNYEVNMTQKERYDFVNVGNNIYQIVLHFIQNSWDTHRHLAYQTDQDYPNPKKPEETLHKHPLTTTYAAGADLWQLIPATTTITAPAELCSYGNNSFDVDFSEAAGITAYKVIEGTEANAVKFVKITKLYAGEGCIIRNTGATAGDPITVKASFNATADATNLMKAGDGSTVMNGEYVNYFLSGVDGVPCLVKMNDGGKAIEEGKAYLQLTAAQAQNAAAFRIDFDNENATAIESVKSVNDQKSDARYNVTGQKVGADYKGIVIVNGKKIINK